MHADHRPARILGPLYALLDAWPTLHMAKTSKNLQFILNSGARALTLARKSFEMSSTVSHFCVELVLYRVRV